MNLATRETRRTRPARFAYVAHYLLMTGVGLAGFSGSPSPAVVRVLGSDWPVYLWSGVFVLFSLAGLAARLRGKLRTEAVAGFATSGAFALWGAMVLLGAGAPSSSVQGGLAFCAVALHHAGWSGILWWWSGTGMVNPDELRQALRRGLADPGGPRATSP